MSDISKPIFVFSKSLTSIPSGNGVSVPFDIDDAIWTMVCYTRNDLSDNMLSLQAERVTLASDFDGFKPRPQSNPFNL